MNDRQTLFEEECIRCDQVDTSYKRSFDNSKDALLLLSCEKTILDANDRFSDLCRYHTSELDEMPFDVLFPKISDHNHLLSQEKLTWHRPLFSFQTLMRQKNETDLPVEVFISPLVFSLESRPVFQALVRKKKSRKRNNDSRGQTADLKSERLKSIGALAGGIAHNFNNIMTGIFGNITLARMEIRDNTDAVTHLDKAEDSMDDAVRLTRQLLTFAKGGNPVKHRFDPAPLIRNTAGLNLAGSNVRLEMDIPHPLWPVHADDSQIEQVVANIVVNARQAMKNGGMLTIRAQNSHIVKENLLTIAKGAYIKLIFRDTGNGISQKDLPRIFDPYFTTIPNGCGMGLSICYSIINKHKGHIAATSQLGTGTIVTVYLPAESPEHPQEISMTSEKSSSDAQARILVMDDEAHILNITQKMLEKFGYAVTITEDGSRAVEKYKTAFDSGAAFDLVIMDLTIPGGMGGKEAAEEILKFDPDARVVVSSGYSNDPVMSDYEAYGLKGIIPKPFRLAELKETVEQLLA